MPLPIPERPVLNAHKQFTLLHKPANIEGTCSTQNFR